MWPLSQPVYRILILTICSFRIVRTDSESIKISQSDPVENLEQSSLIIGILKEINLNEESECAQESKVILDGIQNKDVWALKSKILDFFLSYNFVESKL